LQKPKKEAEITIVNAKAEAEGVKIRKNLSCRLMRIGLDSCDG
jgi:hypothetical protein